jgi:hypothetical protein
MMNAKCCRRERGEVHKNRLSKNVRAAGHVESYMRELGSIPGWL